MAITTLGEYEAALKEKVYFYKSLARAASGTSWWYTLWDGSAGTPPAGTLNVGNTANGLVPTDATTGAPPIVFSSGSGYLTRVEFTSNPVCRMLLYDRLFHCGAYAFNASTTLTSQPSYASRVPGGTDFNGLQLWLETVTAFTGVLAVTVTYTNQSGTTGQTTGALSMIGVPLPVGEMRQLPLAPGDTGLQKIESVTAATATAGTFNLVVARPLWTGRVNTNDTFRVAIHPFDWFGMPQVWSDSCLALICAPDTGVVVTPDMVLEIASA